MKVGIAHPTIICHTCNTQNPLRKAGIQQLIEPPGFPLAGGLLSGKFDLEKPGPPAARRTTFDFPPVDRERTKKGIKMLREVAGKTGLSVARVALARLLTRPFVTSVIIGAKT